MSDRHEAILDAAEEIFAERGYHAAGIADIAAKLGMGHGTFYRYFKNKHDIAVHVLDRVIARFAAAGLAEDPTAADSVEAYRAQVERILEGMMTLVETQPRVVRFFHEQAVTIAPDRLAQALDTYADFTGEFLRNGLSRGFLREDLDVEATSQALVALILEGTRRALQQDSDAHRRWVAAGVALMFSGISKR